MKKISIIVPCYKAIVWAPKLLSSLKEQITDSIEIITVNDGSPDNTLQVLNEIAKDFPQMRVVDQANGGPASARNKGLEYATGEYIWFVDADDIINPGSIELLLNEIQKDPSDIICFNFQEIDMKDNVLNNIKDYGYRYNVTSTGIDAYTNNHIPAYLWNRMIKHSIIKDNNIRFGIIPEDEDFLMNLYFVAKTFRFIPNVIYKYRIMDVSFGKNLSSHVKYYHGYLEVIDKYLSMYPQIRNEKFWTTFLFSQLLNVYTNYNRVKIVNADAINVSRFDNYKIFMKCAKRFEGLISYSGTRGCLLWIMTHMPIVFDVIVYLRYKLKK